MANGQFRSDIKEELGLGKGYLYCSKNALNDDLALANFGKAIAWVSGANYVVGDRRTTSSIQYKCIQNASGRTTAMASDTAYWEFDLENFQTYNTTKTYNIGHKTVSNLLHYICNVDGTTGTFNAANWLQVPISNRLVPFRYHTTAFIFTSDTRFVSYEVLNTVLNKAYHNIYVLLSNGIWNVTFGAPSKAIRLIGQSKFKCTVYCYSYIDNTQNNVFFKNITYVETSGRTTGTLKAENCIFPYLSTSVQALSLLYGYKTYFAGVSGSFIVTHLVNCNIGGASISVLANTIMKNNIFYANSSLGNLSLMNAGNCDNNAFATTVILNAIKAAYPLQNANSVGGATYITTNADYTLASNSPCIGIGANGNNIGAEGVGYPQTNATIFDSALGAIYKNVKKLSTAIIRDQIGKQVVSASSNTVVLDASASSVDDIYTGFRFYISIGLGVGEIHTISDYDGATRTATISDTFTVTPDTTSYYEILDGKLISAIGDLGAVKIVGKINSSTVNYFDIATSTILTQNVSTDDCRNIGSSLTFQLKTGLLADLSDGVTRVFLQDEPLITDVNGYGCGDALFNPDTIASSTLSFRYYQITISFHK